MTILKLVCTGLALWGLHQFLLAHGTPMGAHVITGAAGFLLAVIIGLSKESFV
ncbi:hypothetical protein SAMN05444161_4757 [Rhizobiales bacterium GAS191]|jgi:hypothetical protein|nr:hypothetical protein SAMN05519103_04034 [Rhizobiales bacterium GAS113]SEE06344.1 hypothetical protein SAMN05444161_4757 [Rhizobiales bacterium GAS191]SEE47308.1 hypothetical protein SAMN05519104_6225 [Rhizobiales bacterium GAS188]